MLIDKKKKYIISFVLVLVISLLIGTGLLNRPDKWTQDYFYQRPQVASTDIVIIGIDEKALKQFGPYNTWDRNIVASALEVLSSDSDNQPAVVAVDALYINEANEESDNRLVEAASRLDNVVFGTAAQFGTAINFVDNEASINTYAVLNYEVPFENLRRVSVQGHINAMEDVDGIMRHALWYVQPSGDTRVYSMAYTVADLYLQNMGETVSEPPVNSRGQFYVPFTSEPYTYYDGVSIADLINGDIPSDYYSGKIVFIGPYASGLQDAYFTPIDRSAPMYGVEIQANITQCYIDGNYKREITVLPQIVILFIILFLFSIVLLTVSVKLGVTISIGSFILFPLLSKLLYELGFVTHILWIPVGIFIILVFSVITHYVVASLEKQAVTKSFERYVAPSIVNEILKEGQDSLSLGGKTCDIAVLFVDVRGFTTMSERMEPEKVVYILNKYLSRTAECIDKYSGTLDKFVGDAVMAFWGAPLEQENAVYNACRTALDIVASVKEVSRELKEELGEEINVGVGVHYGSAVVGNMGSERRMDYTAIGDTVNTAARLESNAPAGTVYISRIVADKLGDKCHATSLGGSVKLKGKTDGFEVLTLDSLEEM